MENNLFLNSEHLQKLYNNELKIEENIIKKFDVKVYAHFGNCVAIDMLCDCVCPIPLYNSTGNIGYILKTLIELFDLEREDGVSIDCLNNTPIRIAFDNYKSIAIGNISKDKFIKITDLMEATN